MEAIVSARNLGKTIQDKTILHDISVDVSPGSVVGVIGKNGAGKTTLLEILLGFSPPSTGDSRLFGQDSLSLSSAVKGKIGFVPQQDELVNSLTGAQQLALNASLYRHWNSALMEKLKQAWEVPSNRLIQTLSPGERQKLSTLLALGHEPELLVLDEPAANLDPIARRQFLRELLEISANRERTVLFSTHIVSDLERVADQIWIVRSGALAWYGALDALKESIVRLNIRARGSLPASLPIRHVLSQQISGPQASAVVSDWDPEEIGTLQHALRAEIEVESMSLEDLFIEFHA